jgi:hypothetical protein
LREIEGRTGIDGAVREIAEKWVLQRYNQGPKVQKISQGEEKRSKGKNKEKQSEQESSEENKPWQCFLSQNLALSHFRALRLWASLFLSSTLSISASERKQRR